MTLKTSAPRDCARARRPGRPRGRGRRGTLAQRCHVSWDRRAAPAGGPTSVAPSGFAGRGARRLAIYFGAKHLSHLIKSNYSNIALLKDLMTVPPMTAERHAEVMRKRIAQRRMVEEAKELRQASAEFDKR